MSLWWRRAWRSVVACLATVGLVVTVVCATPLVTWWAGQLAGDWDNPYGQTLLVLAGSALEDGLLGESSYWRSVYAVRAWRAGGFLQVVISGGPPRQPAAEAMRRFLIAEGVPADKIRFEAESSSTRENALNMARLLAGDTTVKVLLTSDYHTFRASRAFRRAGVEVLPLPFPDAIKRGHAWINRPAIFASLSIESAKIVYYRWRGWI